MPVARRPPALKHGLTSRYTRDEWSASVGALAEALMGVAPREPRLEEAAHDAAEAILYLRRVQQCRQLVMEDGALKRAAPTEALKRPAAALSRAVKSGTAAECDALRNELGEAHDAEWILDVESVAMLILGLEFSDRAQELTRLADYERRAASRRRTALRRLDYERTEAERRAIPRRAPA